VPFDLSAAGTSFATAALPALADDDAVDVELDAGAAPEDELLLLLLLLLPHAATATTHNGKSAASSDFLQVTIRLLVSLRPQVEADQHRQEWLDGEAS
jgi:hypothetical protein